MAKNMKAAAKKSATQAQVSFIQLLKSEREVSEPMLDAMRQLWSAGEFDNVVADSFIKILTTLPERQNVVESHKALVGYHRLGGRYFKAYRSGVGFMYAKEIVFNGQGDSTVQNVSPLVFKALSTDSLMPQHLAIRLDRKLKTAQQVV